MANEAKKLTEASGLVSARDDTPHHTPLQPFFFFFFEAKMTCTKQGVSVCQEGKWRSTGDTKSTANGDRRLAMATAAMAATASGLHGMAFFCFACLGFSGFWDQSELFFWGFAGGGGICGAFNAMAYSTLLGFLVCECQCLCAWVFFGPSFVSIGLFSLYLLRFCFFNSTFFLLSRFLSLFHYFYPSLVFLRICACCLGARRRHSAAPTSSRIFA